MATSETAICNSALVKIGAARISSLSDTTPEGILCNEQYEKLRDDLLYGHPWHFAKVRVELSADATAPEYEWGVRYAIPADCLRVLGTNLQADDPWVTENGYILTNATALKILYIKKVTDTTTFSKAFDEVLATRLAAEICYSLTQNASLQKNLYEAFREKLAEARSLDSQESGNVQKVEASEWLNARF